jgi:dipeptidase E
VTGALFLASEGLGALPGFLSAHAAGVRAAHVPTAANHLEDATWVARVGAELAAMGLELDALDLERSAPAETTEALERVDAIVVTGGDPFHLLRCARSSGFAPAARAALERGAVYVGQSAGAIVAGPDLRPILLTSPFAPEAGKDLEGLGLTDVVVLPHENRPGRAERNRRARERWSAELRIVALADDEALEIARGGAGERLISSPAARAADPPAPPARG